MRKYLLLLFIVVSALPAIAQQLALAGRVTDQNGRAVAFTSVYIRNSTYGTVANEQGTYQLKLGAGNYAIIYRAPGYKEQVENITISDADVRHNVQLVDESYSLKQLSTVNGHIVDSAEGIVQKVLDRRKYFLKQVNAYSCVEYIKGVQKLVSAPKFLMGQNVSTALSVDSTGKGVLYQTESISDFSFEQPDKMREVMRSTLTAGQNAAFSYNKASDLSVNFYEDLITVPGLSSHGFVSPLGGHAMQYYHYTLQGSKIENGVVVHKIQVTPKRMRDPAFTGFVYIVDGDWRIYGVDLMLTGKANSLNLVDTLRLSQQYVPIRDSVWEPLSVQYSFKGNVLGFKFEGYYLGIYNNYKLDPVFPDHYFTGERMRLDTTAKSRDLAYWQQIRPVPLTAQENTDYNTKQNMQDMKEALEKAGVSENSVNRFNILPYIAFGYKATYHDHRDSIYVDPFLQTVFYNTVEGAGLNLRGTYVHYMDTLRSFNVTPNLRYGWADKLFNANVFTTYNYDPLNRGKFILNFGSTLLDLSNVGTRSLYFNTLSTLLSEQNYVKYYRSEFIEGGFQRDIANGILWKADLSYANRTQLYNNSFYSINTYVGRRLTSNNPLMPDAPANDRSLLFPQNQALTFTTSFTFTFDQQYITRPNGREFLPSDYPQIRLNYRKGINGLFGSDVDYDFASVELFHEHYAPGVFGFSSFKFVAGDFFNNNRLYFIDYNHFQGNQGTTFDPTPGSFHFLPFYTFSTNGPFLEGHFEHNFSGYFFNRIPLLRDLKLDEVIGANYLSENNNRDYSEFYVGVQRLIFRIDYGWSFEGNHKYLQGFRIFYGIK
ncbi:MAG TPA: DUF5686 family protein [Mucilaginibacter sp.]|nr:DUF5686 family protein [Mucilaginibacter sp.]